MWEYRAVVTDVHDGDTVTCRVDLGFDAMARVKIRLEHVWTPELSQPGGQEARDEAMSWLHEAVVAAGDTDWPFVLRTARTVKSDEPARSFTRYIGTVLTRDLSDSLNLHMMGWMSTHGGPAGVGASTA